MGNLRGQSGLLVGAAVLVATVVAVAIRRWRGRRSSREVVGILGEDGVIELMVLPKRLRPGESKLQITKFPEGLSVVVEDGWSSEVTDRDLEEVLTLSNVIRLQLYGTGLTDSMLARIIDRHAATLEVLSVHSTDVSDEGLLAINRCSRLIDLSASRTRITDQTLGRVTGLSRLKRIAFGGTGVSDLGFQQLRGLQSLELISALHCGLSVESLAVLPTLPALKVAFLAGNRFSDEELARFREEFPSVLVNTEEDA